MTRFSKDPDSILDYMMDWSRWLGEDEITSATWEASDAGITIDSQANTTSTATVWVSGGTVDETYTLTCRIVTTEGRTEDRSFDILIKEK
jgi:hypothetical protein